ncbi:Na+/H+ antiporter subunit E [Plantactinospora sp. B6F1]|uniref:Na+/H+ antiporter subunit E n=1 Tax=Plantactinospora sp. B6F1 TaxID=3158971 RepID=UPI0032D962BB
MTAVRPDRRIRDRLIAVGGLTVLWMLLWGVFSWATFFGGLVVSAVVITVFPLPPVTFAGRPRVLGLLRFAARFLLDLVVASAHLAWTAVRFRYRPYSAVIAVRLTVRSDLNLTLCGEAVSLIPGSIIVDTDRAAGVLYIHVFDVRDRNAVEEFRREVYALEARIVRAIGSAAELKQITNERGHR